MYIIIRRNNKLAYKNKLCAIVSCDFIYFCPLGHIATFHCNVANKALAFHWGQHVWTQKGHKVLIGVKEVDVNEWMNGRNALIYYIIYSFVPFDDPYRFEWNAHILRFYFDSIFIEMYILFDFPSSIILSPFWNSRHSHIKTPKLFLSRIQK